MVPEKHTHTTTKKQQPIGMGNTASVGRLEKRARSVTHTERGVTVHIKSPAPEVSKKERSVSCSDLQRLSQGSGKAVPSSNKYDLDSEVKPIPVRRRSFTKKNLIIPNLQLSPKLPKWKKLVPKEEGPGDITGHGAVVMGSRLYVFGGSQGLEGDGDNVMARLWHYDFRTRRWTRVESGEESGGPRARAALAMCEGLDPDTFIVSGGVGKGPMGMPLVMGDVYQFSTLTQLWCRLVDAINCPQNFCRFYGQSMCRYGEEHLYFFGGSDGGRLTNDVYRYSIFTTRVEKLWCGGTPPSPRYKHQAFIYEHHLYVVGGGGRTPAAGDIDVFRLDLAERVGRYRRRRGVPPAANNHACGAGRRQRQRLPLQVPRPALARCPRCTITPRKEEGGGW
ncbi:unnamed protein product, partial [Heterosigma akashiwo]